MVRTGNKMAPVFRDTYVVPESTRETNMEKDFFFEIFLKFFWFVFQITNCREFTKLVPESKSRNRGDNGI